MKKRKIEDPCEYCDVEEGVTVWLDMLVCKKCEKKLKKLRKEDDKIFQAD